MDAEKKAPMCPKLSQMAALLQGGRASSDGSTATWPRVTVYFQYGSALSTVSFHTFTPRFTERGIQIGEIGPFSQGRGG